MRPRVNKILDFGERVAWTAIQAFAATAIVTGLDDWQLTLKVAGGAAILAALKVIVGQNIGRDDTGAIIPGGTAIEPPPQA